MGAHEDEEFPVRMRLGRDGPYGINEINRRILGGICVCVISASAGLGWLGLVTSWRLSYYTTTTAWHGVLDSGVFVGPRVLCLTSIFGSRYGCEDACSWWCKPWEEESTEC